MNETPYIIEPTWITDNIAIGSRFAAVDEPALRKAGITAVLNVAKEWNQMVSYPNDTPITYAKVGIDETSTKPSELLTCADVLDMLVARGEKVLVHCFAGISRSVIVVAVWLCISRGYSLRETLSEIKAKRPESDPNKYLLKQAEVALY